MWTLVLTIAVFVNGVLTVKDVNLNTEAPSLNQCMSDQPSMAKYIGEHPNEKIVRWKCVDKSKPKLDI